MSTVGVDVMPASSWLLIRSGVAPATWLARLGRSERVATFALEIDEGAELPLVGAACQWDRLFDPPFPQGSPRQVALGGRDVLGHSAGLGDGG